jgi:hypothetical protein
MNMRNSGQLTRREKILIAIIFILIVFWQADIGPTQAAAPPLETGELYLWAQRYANRGEMARAVAFLYAYIQRNPHDYKMNVKGHADKVDKVFNNWVREVQDKIAIAERVNGDLDRCQHYPCPEMGQSYASQSAGFPTDMVKVCEHANYGGKCSYLGVGEYNNHWELGVPNDSISSVRVGQNAKLLLCAQSLAQTAECLEFSGSDPNLGNNTIPGYNYSLNDNASTARVSYKDGSGFALP